MIYSVPDVVANNATRSQPELPGKNDTANRCDVGDHTIWLTTPPGTGLPISIITTD
jgi:hypothetical protein